jgi:hypothetical protein
MFWAEKTMHEKDVQEQYDVRKKRKVEKVNVQIFCQLGNEQ